MSSQISRYLFATSLIEYDIEHETVDSSVVTSSGSSESPRAEYSFVIISIDSSSSKSPEFLAMIQQMMSNPSFSSLVGIYVKVQYTSLCGIRCVHS